MSSSTSALLTLLAEDTEDEELKSATAKQWRWVAFSDQEKPSLWPFETSNGSFHQGNW